MAESLNVIALISGGKDSFFSLFHCLRNGHKVIALGNLYPEPKHSDASTPISGDEEKEDLNSFMYQTVGHQVIPLYSKALGLPLYRQEIKGTAVVTGLTYAQSERKGDEEEETESLLPLLKKIMKAHPEANALSTGAILSTYQRTRIESIALRLGLTPLSYLWQYPFLPGHSDISLLQNMSAVKLDARIIKIASGGLDESFLWENVARIRGMNRLDKAAKRFGVGGGAVMGEGGEYETLVLDGPDGVFKGKIVVEDCDRVVVREGGGAAWLRIKHATVVMKDQSPEPFQLLRPKLLEPRFESIFEDLKSEGHTEIVQSERPPTEISTDDPNWISRISSNNKKACHGLVHWTFDLQSCTEEISISSPGLTLEEEIEEVVDSIRKQLERTSLIPSDIVFAMIVLRSIGDFAAVNKIYGTLFPSPNPAARVTIACGDTLPGNGRVMIHLTVFDSKSLLEQPDISVKKVVVDDTTEDLPESPLLTSEALHVQSRSYWAPANIGPYSQAISVPTSLRSNTRSVYVAGQIPLIPATMLLPASLPTTQDNFHLQAILSLQHLWQVGREMNVNCWTGAIAFLSKDNPTSIKNKALQAKNIWTQIHSIENPDEDEDTERDLWEEKHHYNLQIRGGMNDSLKQFPGSDSITHKASPAAWIPPIFAGEVEELPRQSLIEWQALLGVCGTGPFKASCDRITNLGTIWKLEASDQMDTVTYSIIAIPIDNSGVCEASLHDWHSSLESRPIPQATYIDTSIKELWSSYLISGVVPCRSLWDPAADGKPLLAAIIVYMM